MRLGRVGVLGLVVGLTGCLAFETSTVDGLRVLTASGSVPVTQQLVPSVEIQEGETSFLFTAELPTEARGYVAAITDPNGQVVFDGPSWWEGVRNKTNAPFSSSVLTVNWPVSAADGPLTPGVWTITTPVGDVGASYDATFAVAADDDLFRGALRVEIVFVGALADDAEVVRGVQAAAEIWQDDVYASLGLTLTLETRTWDGPTTLASPGFGDPEAYREAVADTPLTTLSVLVIEAVNDGANVFGVSGGIPGPLVPTDRSVVAVSALEATGLDGVFSASEERLLAETLGHEMGHYLGLYHPAEIPLSGQRVTTWDALDDTEECPSFDACVRVLGDNLMFPTPLCAESEGLGCATFVQQTSVTNAQLGVLHRYAGVR